MKSIYFIGIGGIGMSAIARYFLSQGYAVGGYDLTPSAITDQLTKEGAKIHYDDNVASIPEIFLSRDTDIVYTPAIPKEHTELRYFLDGGYRVMKRSEILGEITRQSQALCIAGTHGKTTTSSMLAHLLYQSKVRCNAFLGGISNNYQTNLLLSKNSNLVVVEADEFDRSFHRLSPYMAAITSADPDHLDIYGTPEAYRESFEHFTSLVSPEGVLILRHGIAVSSQLPAGARLYTYADSDIADFWSSDIEIQKGRLFFTWHYPPIGVSPAGEIRVELGVPLRINVDNATVAMAMAYLNGVSLQELKQGIASFQGVQRRFDRVLRGPRYYLIDDYAHHPEELSASIRSVRALYPTKPIMGIFQPHLYSRTKDFHTEFAESLNALDEVILLDIYPARERPIPGVTSAMIGRKIKKPVQILSKEGLLPYLESREQIPSVVLMLGAGDIDRLVQPVARLLQKR